MTKEKSQLKEYVEVVSVLQWVLSFLFMGKVFSSAPQLRWSISNNAAELFQDIFSNPNMGLALQDSVALSCWCTSCLRRCGHSPLSTSYGW